MAPNTTCSRAITIFDCDAPNASRLSAPKIHSLQKPQVFDVEGNQRFPELQKHGFCMPRNSTNFEGIFERFSRERKITVL
ncbi:MAG: hypothetical protein ABFC34_09135 [Methanobacterium sp.]